MRAQAAAGHGARGAGVGSSPAQGEEGEGGEQAEGEACHLVAAR